MNISMVEINNIDEKIYLGYILLEERNYAEACNFWWEAWNNIIYLMEHYNILAIDEFDNNFKGTQSILNWVYDFEMELHNAGRDDKSYLEKRIEFCSEYIKRNENNKDLNIENMRRAIAESYIDLGKYKEGDALFGKYLEEDPKWGWGWIAWSDCYWIFHGNNENDYEKAEYILKRALTIEGLRDIEDVMERLMNFYEDTDRQEDADKIRRELNKLGKSKKMMKTNNESIPCIKIGRNDPCLCGSGKKYKKCCGK